MTPLWAQLIKLVLVLFYTIIGVHVVFKTGQIRGHNIPAWSALSSIMTAILIWLWPVLLFITIGDAVHDAYVAPDNRRNYE